MGPPSPGRTTSRLARTRRLWLWPPLILNAARLISELRHTSQSRLTWRTSCTSSCNWPLGPPELHRVSSAPESLDDNARDPLAFTVYVRPGLRAGTERA